MRGLKAIFASRPASFEAGCSIGEAVWRLAAITRRGPWTAWLATTRTDFLVGKISEEAVRVWWYRGPFKPLPAVFSGAFLVRGGTVVLEGRFQFSAVGRVILVTMVAVLLLFLFAGVLGLLVVLESAQPAGEKIITTVFLGVLVVTTCVAVFFSSQPLPEDDIEKVSSNVDRALKGDPSNSGCTRRRPVGS
jgi:hypothetical protein